jgi:hypothetical protein
MVKTRKETLGGGDFDCAMPRFLTVCGDFSEVGDREFLLVGWINALMPHIAASAFSTISNA